MARSYTCPAGGSLCEVCAAVTRGRRLLWGLVHMNSLHRDLLGHCPTYKTQGFTWAPSYAAVTFKHVKSTIFPGSRTLAPNSCHFPLGPEEGPHALNEVTPLPAVPGSAPSSSADPGLAFPINPSSTPSHDRQAGGPPPSDRGARGAGQTRPV